jgi:hypothetical protein
VKLDLRVNDVGEDAPATLDHRDGGFVTAGFDPQG